MKRNYLFLCLFYFIGWISVQAQLSSGDIAFTAFNADGDKDFAIVALADIPANSTIYITDNETSGVGSPSALSTGEGVITWMTGGSIITVGTVVVFTDTDNASNPSFGASVGSIARSGSFNISTSKDGLIAFIGSDSSTPTTYLTAIQIGNDNAFLGPFDGNGTTLTNTGLDTGSTIAVIDNTASPDGGYYSGSRVSEASFSAYRTLLVNSSNWTTETTNGENILPISTTSFTSTATTWDGSEETDWTTSGNWSDGVPGSTSDVTIPSGLTNYPTAGSAVEVGTVSIASGATLIANSTFTGTVTYQRNLATENWYLVSSTVSGETYNNGYVSANELAINGTNNAIGSYTTGTDAWSYMQTDGSGTFNNGQGYAVRKATGEGNSTISFTGSMNTSDVSIAMATGGNGAFNLVGNPWTAHVNSATLLGANTGNLVSETIWLWNQGTGNYETKVTVDNFILAPGQGFFVSAANTNNFTFAQSNQQHSGSDTFQRTSRPEVHLLLTDGTHERFAKIYYIEGTTTGFDNGYDGEAFNGQANAIDIYTHLVTDSEGKNFQIQSLPNSNYENMVIPVGVTSAAGSVTFSVEDMNLPTGYKVYLEDKDNGNFIRLDEEGSKYEAIFDNPVSGIGRFFLHITPNALSSGSVDLSNISAYLSDARNLKVVGIMQGTTRVKLFNILGKQVFNTSIQSKGADDIPLPSLRQGVYILQITSEEGSINKKLVIE